MTHFGMSVATRTIVLIVTLLVRGLLGVGPENLVVCVHGDGRFMVESTSDLCCEKPSCLSGRSPVETLTKLGGADVSDYVGTEGDDDDCADFSFATSDSSTASHASPVLSSTNEVSSFFAPARHEVMFVAEAPALAGGSWLRAPPPPRLGALNTTILRC
jgi:hypothetical protein